MFEVKSIELVDASADMPSMALAVRVCMCRNYKEKMQRSIWREPVSGIMPRPQSNAAAKIPISILYVFLRMYLVIALL